MIEHSRDLEVLEAAAYERGFAMGKHEGLRVAAETAMTWGGYPPSPLGRRAKLADAILEMTEWPK